MNQADRIKQLFERTQDALRAKPFIGLKTATSVTRMINGTTCEISEGKWSLTADLSEKVGGNGIGPDSGVFGRAAFGSCAAISYVLWAAKFGVTLDSLEVTVETDADNSGLYDAADVPAGYLRARSTIRVDSTDPVEKVLAVFDKGDKHSPYHEFWSRAVDIERKIILNGQEV